MYLYDKSSSLIGENICQSMRRIVTFLQISVLVISQILPFFAFAQAKNITVKSFEVTFPEKVIVNEAFDITVKALWADGKKIDNYEGTIYCGSLNRPPADVVLPVCDDAGEGYTFTLSDQWEHTFSKGVTFKKPGVYELDIYEIENEGDGVSKTISITAAEKDAPPATKVDVTISEPANNITVSTKTITVAGTSKATSAIQILLNSKKVATAQTDKDGKFSVSVWELVSGNNDIVAEVLDGNGAVAGTSAKTTIKFGTDAPTIKDLSIKEWTEILAGETINFTANWDTNLKTVQLKIGDKTIVLEEDKNELGTYTGAFKTSEFEWEFSPIVAVTSQLGTKAEFKDLIKFTTVAAKIENIEIKTTEDKKVRFTFDLTPDIDQIQYFEIKYGTETEKYTKTVVTYDKSKISEQGKYTWYIPNIEPGDYFALITGLDKDKKATSINSGEQTFSVALDAAPTCFIEKISGFKVEERTSSYSVISWDKLSDATAYQIFKRDSSGEFALIDEITGNKYRINIDTTAEREIFEDFRVRGICKVGDFVGEGAFSESVAVQTGPELIIFFALFMASGIAFILVRRGYIH